MLSATAVLAAISAAYGAGSISHVDFAVRTALALLFGSLVGFERQWRQRLAGLRTNALVATGASLFVQITPLVGSAGTNDTQIAAYVVSGIGFLAGGVIFKERLSVFGLNTAATLWCTAAIGVLTGYGFLIEATIAVVAVLVANVVLRPVVSKINRQPHDGTEVVSSYEVRAVCRQDVEDRVRLVTIEAVKSASMSLVAVYSDDVEATTRVEVTADVSVAGRADARMERVVSRIGVEPGVVAVSWKLVPKSDEEQEIVSEL